MFRCGLASVGGEIGVMYGGLRRITPCLYPALLDLWRRMCGVLGCLCFLIDVLAWLHLFGVLSSALICGFGISKTRKAARGPLFKIPLFGGLFGGSFTKTRFCTCPGSLASSLEYSKKRKKLAEASCKTCGGRFAVDGIGAISRNMVGTVGLEVTSSISPELNWKTVTKGKRSRKAVARCMNRSLDLSHNSPKRVGDFSGSDSDKFGETGNGQSLSDKAEYIPLKKRRHFLRSPSPSSRPPLCGAEPMSPQVLTPSSEDLLSDHNGSSGSYTNGRVGAFTSCLDKVPGHIIGGFDSSDNFAGIALLAAAACFNNIDEDAFVDKLDATEVSSAPQKSDDMSLPQIESMHCSESGKQVSSIENKDCSLVVGSVDGSHSSYESKELVSGKSASPKIDRLHWDLNTPMDAWDQPNSDGNGKDVSEEIILPDKEGCEIEKVAINKRNDAEPCLPPMKIENAAVGTISKLEENDSKELYCNDGIGMKPSTLSIFNGVSRGAVHSSSADSGRNELVNSPKAESCHSSEVSGRCQDTKSDTMGGAHIEDKCKDADGLSLSNPSDHNAAFKDDSASDKLAGGCDGHMEFAEGCLKTCELPDGSMGKEVCLDSCQALEAENSESGLCNDPHPSSKHSTAPISTGGGSDVSCDAKEDSVKLVSGNLGTDAGEDASSKGILAEHEDPNLSNGGSEKINTMDGSGYDSPYEDGELRVSVFNFENELEDGEQECLDYESEGRVGGGSDAGDSPDPKTMEADAEGTDKSSVLAVHGRETEFMKSGFGSSLRSGEENENSEKTEVSGEKVSNQGSGTTEERFADVMMVERNYDVVRRLHTADHMDVNEEIGEVRSRTNRGKLLSRIEGPPSLDNTEKDVAYRRSRDVGDPYFRKERNGAPDRFVAGYRSDNHYRGRRNEGDGECDYWNSRERFSSGYRGPEGRGQSRQRIAFGQSVDKFGVDSHNHRHPFNYAFHVGRDSSPDRFASRFRSTGQDRDKNGGNNQLTHWGPRMRYPYHGAEDNRQTRPRCVTDSFDKFGGYNNSYDRKESMNTSSRTMQGPPDWRRSPIDRDDYHHGGLRRNPGLSSRGTRGGFRKFSDYRGFRDDYHQPMNEENAASGRAPHYAWREQKFLPHSARGARTSLPHRSSRSRSRTRSPRPWLPLRERDSRHRSRSPDFRSESQLERGRVPFQNPNFEADYDDSFVSPPRGRFSPQRNFRRAEDQNVSDSHVRNRRSPFNGYGQGQRMDSVGLSGRLKSDDSFRPTLRPGRFPPVAGVGRGCKLEDGNEEKAHGDNRSETVQ
ncbi:OLC1v1027478C1 [Oldenlandia corymbosa var. corymbosa]|uniref:OLC1v1027478C1 n=1 Tax=Oldenlandia corymbosa var. corymbosa TaxID=529605 RepID=A0AAV1C9U7_OLDCO|nr:OLC1v1027478C1 [Oldenlandia corymbosa var. corymbosa]